MIPRLVDNSSGGLRKQRPRSEYFSMQRYISLESFCKTFKNKKNDKEKKDGNGGYKY